MPRNAGWLAGALLAATIAAWAASLVRMRDMNAGPGSDLGGLGWFFGLWVTMMAAMMLPSAAPAVLFFARVSRERTMGGGDGLLPAGLFIGSYLAVWAAFGLASYGVYRLVTAYDTTFLAWDRAGPYLAGGAIALAGLYELSPLKRVCLGHCRSPLHFLFKGWRAGRVGAVRMGCEHGAYCVGCCFGLMVILFALGVMSLLWMAALTVVIFAEKVLPRGERLTIPLAVAFVVLGISVALAADRVPGVTRPGSTPGMQMGAPQSLRD